METPTILIHVERGFARFVYSSQPVHVIIFDEDLLRAAGVSADDRDEIFDLAQKNLSVSNAVTLSLDKTHVDPFRLTRHLEQLRDYQGQPNTGT